jgi:uridine phosphorylase
MSADVTLATISRGTAGELRVAIEAHPRTGDSIVTITHVRADGMQGPRAPLRPSELDQVAHALTIAAQTLRAANGPKHHHVTAEQARRAAERELERELF